MGLPGAVLPMLVQTKRSEKQTTTYEKEKANALRSKLY